MEILTLIDALEELTVQARRLPVGGNLVIERKRILDLIDQLRLAVPLDVRQATQVLEARDEVMRDASDQAARILEEATQEREDLLSQTSIMRDAQERRQQLLADSEGRARQTIADAEATAAAHLSEAAEAAARQLDDADHYALEVLTRLEAQLGAFLESIRGSISTLQEGR